MKNFYENSSFPRVSLSGCQVAVPLENFLFLVSMSEGSSKAVKNSEKKRSL